ncbi:MAG: peptidoglycan DD-metalloendopeptidase family protein [Cyanobacteria bacterium J06638_6]
MTKKDTLEILPAAKSADIYAALALLQLVLGIGTGLALSGKAFADTVEPSTVESSTQENAVETSAAALTPVVNRTHISGPAVTLTVPTSSVTRPEVSPQRPSVSADVTSPPPASQPMYSPVPPPPPAAITITLPAPSAAPSMAESLLKPAVESMADRSSDGSSETLEIEQSTVATPPSAPAPTSADETPVVPDSIAADESVPAGYNSVFIDSTDYSLGATEPPAANAPSVVFSERSTGCQITLASGQSNPNSSCAPTSSANPARGGQGEIQVGPIAVGSQGVRLGSTTIVSRAALNEKLRPLNVMRRGSEEYVFPLSVPASISSLFGWRMHPIHNSWRFHAGTDIAAPTGTPVLATRAGRVTVSNVLGGYGLTVILRHGDNDLESRYAHLSQIAVRPGEWVEQGEVIGLVGSTGTSTGPHLHFELRQLTAEGWVAVDPIEVLEYGVANLLEIINNPMLALNSKAANAAQTNADGTPIEYPFRPAQPNAS